MIGFAANQVPPQISFPFAYSAGNNTPLLVNLVEGSGTLTGTNAAAHRLMFDLRTGWHLDRISMFSSINCGPTLLDLRVGTSQSDTFTSLASITVTINTIPTTFDFINVDPHVIPPGYLVVLEVSPTNNHGFMTGNADFRRR